MRNCFLASIEKLGLNSKKKKNATSFILRYFYRGGKSPSHALVGGVSHEYLGFNAQMGKA